MGNPARRIAWCSLATLVALYVVGAVSNGSLRHEVQTLPLWAPIVAGFQRREAAKWMALPCLAIWLLLMTMIWLYLAGVARVVTGRFSPVEIAMTLVVGAAAAIGIATGIGWRTKSGAAAAAGWTALFALLQAAALRISFIPYIATR